MFPYKTVLTDIAGCEARIKQAQKDRRAPSAPHVVVSAADEPSPPEAA